MEHGGKSLSNAVGAAHEVDALLPPLAALNSIEDIQGAVMQLDETVRVEGFVHGHIRKEHMLKQLQIAAALGRPEIVTFSHKVVQALSTIDARDTKDIDNEDAYKNYLRNLHADLHLDENELREIATKFSPEIFASIDTELERVVLLINALPGGETLSCCSGHALSDKPEEDRTHRAYLMATYTDPRMTSLLRVHIDRIGEFVNPSEQKNIGRALERSSNPYPRPTYLMRFTYPTVTEQEAYNAALPAERIARRAEMLDVIEQYLNECRKLPR